jgi:hypothetical protein
MVQHSAAIVAREDCRMGVVSRAAVAAVAAIGIIVLAAASALAQTPAAPAAPEKTSTQAAKLSVKTTPVSVIVANPRAKAALEAVAPDIASYYRLIGNRTLTQVAALSHGELDDGMLKQIQAEFDKL